MKHIPAHRLADLVAGNWNSHSAAKAREHIKNCSHCLGAMKRIEVGRQAMGEIASADSPELGWDHIATRIYWSTSSERRASEREEPSAWRFGGRKILRNGFVAAGACCALVVAAYMGLYPSSADEAEQLAASPAVQVEADTSKGVSEPMLEPAKPVAENLQGVITFAGAEVVMNGAALDFDSLVRQGSRFSTGEGELVVQFGLHNSFRLAPQSTLWLQSFDSQSVVLDVVGRIDIDIEKRGAGQEFVVVAGEQRVVVHGTAFRVDFRETRLDVSCTRGKVVVSDGQEQVNVPAGQRFGIIDSEWQDVALRALPIRADRLALLDAEMAMPTLAVWNPGNPLESSSVLQVKSAGEQEVALDGIALASGDFLVRTSSGRHQIARVNSDGSVADGNWYDVEAGQQVSTSLAMSLPKAVDKSRRARAIRKRELKQAINARGKVSRCLAPLEKQGLMAGAYVDFEIGMNSDGTQRYLNIVGSNLSPVIQRCLRTAVSAETLAVGGSAEFSLHLAF
ncbi:MAG: FecR domain-containing protein [Kofleriaceae bacterium]|nr:FecR domain-containing protein [Kofleriaceae bacterium]